MSTVRFRAEAPYAAVAEWQTRYFEGVVTVRSCEFKSHQPHHHFFFCGAKQFHMRSWRNWQTRYLQAVVGLPVRVQISPTAPQNNRGILGNVFFLCPCAGRDAGGALQFLPAAGIIQSFHAAVAEWQTRYFEGVVTVRSCEFKSHQPHHRGSIFGWGFFRVRC